MADQDKLFETLLAGLLDWVWGKGKADIQRQIQQATPDTLAPTIGHITFALVQQGADQAHQAGHTLDTDMLMGVATELIESLMKMAAAMNLQFDAQAVAFQALTQALNDYAASLPDGSAAQQEAKEALAQFSQQDMDTAASTLSEIGERHGVDPFAPQGGQQSPQGGGQGGDPMQSMAAPQQQQGLMGAV